MLPVGKDDGMRQNMRDMFLTRNEATICLELWATQKFDTAHIASLLQVAEHKVSRCIHLARSIRDEMRAVQ
jgi:hypothetical protein